MKIRPFTWVDTRSQWWRFIAVSIVLVFVVWLGWASTAAQGAKPKRIGSTLDLSSQKVRSSSGTLALANSQPLVLNRTSVQNWLQRNWRWLIPVAVVALILLFVMGAKLWRPRAKQRRSGRRRWKAPAQVVEPIGSEITQSTTAEDQDLPIRRIEVTSANRTEVAAAAGEEQKTPELPLATTSLSPLPEVMEPKVESPKPNTPTTFEQTGLELKKLLAGREYNVSLIDVSDSASRQLVAAGLISALSSRSFEQHEHARRAFVDLGYFDETTRDLRMADSPGERTAAARKLGVVRDARGIAHLIAALYDTAPEVRRAAVESLGQIGDNSAIEPLNELLQRESSRLLPEAVIRHAINSITVTEVKRNTNERPLRVVETTNQVDQANKRDEEFQSFASALKRDIEAQAESLASVTPAVPVAPSSVPPPPAPRQALPAEPVVSKLAEEEIQLELEEQALRRATEELDRRRLEAKAARQRAEEGSRQPAEREAQVRAEIEARIRAEDEARRRVEEEVGLRKLEEETRLKADLKARAEAEDEARFRLEAETLRRAAEELARKRAEAEMARKIAEEEARRRAEEDARQRAAEKASLLAQEESKRKADEEMRRQIELETRSRIDEEAGQEAEEERGHAQEERIRAEAEDRLKAEETRRRAEEEVRRIAEEQTRHAIEEARQRAVEEARRIAEEETRRAVDEARQLAAEEARRIAEEEGRHLAEKALLRRSQAEGLLREAEERQRSEEEQFRMELEALLKAADDVARGRREIEAARKKAEEELRRLEENRQRIIAEQQRIEDGVRQQAEEEERRLAELEHLKLQAEEQVRKREEQEKKIRAEIESLHRVEEEQRQRIEAETSRLAEALARLREGKSRLDAEEQARLQAEKGAHLVEEARLRTDEDGRRRADEEARLRAEEEAQRRTDEEARLRAEEAELLRTKEEARQRYEEQELIRANQFDSEATTDLGESSLETPEVFTSEESWGGQEVEDEPVTASVIASAAVESSTTQSVTEDLDKGIDLIRAEKGFAPVGEESNISAELLQLLNSESPAERSAALADLATIGGEEAFKFISGSFDDQEPEVRNAAARALYMLQADRAASFTRVLREGSPERRRKIGSSLASSGLAEDAIANLTGESREKTYDAFSLLFLMAKAGEVQTLMKAIEDYPNVEVRLAVVKLLALSGQPEIVPAFRRLAVRGSLPSEVRSAVMEAIYQISSQGQETATSAA